MTGPHDLRMMPPEAPLAMPTQTFRTAPRVERRRLPRARRADMLWRAGAFGPAFVLATSLMVGLAWWVSQGNAMWGEVLVVLFIGTTLIWVTLSVSAVALALAHLPRRAGFRKMDRGPSLEVALLVPVCNEGAAEVLGNIAAMRAELAAGPRRHRYAFFVLSDTQDAAIAADEARAVAHLRSADPGGIPVHYRRRPANTDRKIGNINDWITRWGGAWEAMVVLDADSLMSGAAIRQLSDEMAQDPESGLIQSFPLLISSETLFGRMQEFATAVYGWLPAEGLALWSRTEGNYWGHNAIIRVRAFAESARLPHLRARDGGTQLILSHDFIEAGMLRRAGWSVRFLPQPGGSYEEPPATLVDYVLRDRRWCRGNLQHLRLLSARGFHPISRFHLLHGAVAYLLSPAWLGFLVVWAALLPIAGPPESYFSPENPHFPAWPVWPQLSRIDGGWLLAAVLAMLLLPKILAAGLMLRTKGVAQLYGGAPFFLAAALIEMTLAVVYAPILMVQQSKAVLRAVAGRPEVWVPQRRMAVNHGWPALLRFHWLEVALGTALVWGIGSGLLSTWLSLVTFSLIGAPLLSRLSGMRVSGRAIGPLRLDTPCSLRVPRVARTAKVERARLRQWLATEERPPSPAFAAE